jgi:hypothetical protein
MIIKARGAVTLPRRPHGIGNVLAFCRETIHCLQQLRDRAFDVPPSRGGSGGSSTYVPWKPAFTRTGTDPTYVYTCRFNLGTLNDVAASNWDEDHTLPTDDSVRFVMLEVTASSGQVTGLEIILETDAPIEDTVLIDTPPTVWRILLGVVDKTSGSMIETKNLQAVASEIYRESKVVVTPGGEPFSRYWRWSHSPVT